ncbi:hypothetical protein Ddc_15195 [Ditylenchus destructor]|nr:hypothetical protein Ddc_15195 [Ditylenchus destructor]
MDSSHISPKEFAQIPKPCIPNSFLIPKFAQRGSVGNITQFLERRHRCLFTTGILCILLFWLILAIFLYIDRIFPDESSSDFKTRAKENQNLVLLVLAATLLVAGIFSVLASCGWSSIFLQLNAILWALGMILALTYFYKSPGWLSSILTALAIALGLIGYLCVRCWRGHLRRNQTVYSDDKDHDHRPQAQDLQYVQAMPVVVG